MIERLSEFLPSLIALSIIAVLGNIYVVIILPRIFGKENYKNTEWMKNWTENHRLITYFFIIIPMVVIAGPATEELLFRGPLVIIFSQISGYAWPAIIFSSVVFALLHYFGKINEYLYERVKPFHEKYKEKEGYTETEGDAETDKNHKKKTVRIIRISRAISSSGMGLLIGYLGINYQSLWLCVGIHAAWNLLVTVILPISIILLTITVVILLSMTDKIRLCWEYNIKHRLQKRGILKDY